MNESLNVNMLIQMFDNSVFVGDDRGATAYRIPDTRPSHARPSALGDAVVSVPAQQHHRVTGFRSFEEHT